MRDEVWNYINEAARMCMQVNTSLVLLPGYFLARFLALLPSTLYYKIEIYSRIAPTICQYIAT